MRSPLQNIREEEGACDFVRAIREMMMLTGYCYFVRMIVITIITASKGVQQLMYGLSLRIFYVGVKLD